MEMCYNEALVMPNNYVVMDNEEMTYVDGGLYMTNGDCWAFAGAVGITLSMNIPSVVALITACSASLPAVLSTIPVVGTLLGLYGVATIVNSAESISSALMEALFNGEGMEIKVGFRYFTPYLKCSAK